MGPQEAKFVGCILGAAIGDALGLPFVGQTPEQIAAAGPIRDFVPPQGVSSVVVPVAELGDLEVGEALLAGQWTENTQLLMALAETLIEEGGVLIPEAWGHKLVRWVNDAPRMPDVSTLQAALQLRTGGVFWDESADPEGADSGPAARVAPIGLLYAGDALLRRRNAVTLAQVTHGDPDAQAAAMAVSEAIAQLLPILPGDMASWDGGAFLAALAETVASASPAYAEFARCLQLAETLLHDGVDRPAAIRLLGVSGWSRETIPCVLYCVASHRGDLETLLTDTIAQIGRAH